MKPKNSPDKDGKKGRGKLSRRDFITCSVAGGIALAAGGKILYDISGSQETARVFIGKAPAYDIDIASIVRHGLSEIGFDTSWIKGKRIALKPNLVETNPGDIHINTHPRVLRGAIEAFLHFGAGEVIVAEGAGHCRDSQRLLAESGTADVLKEDRISFIDINYDEVFGIPNKGGMTRLPSLIFPECLRRADLVVSMPKLKTHHWAGVTLSMKNLFGIMPGSFYGWPKNVLHFHGIPEMIYDISATARPGLAIVDGIVGMEGDGPIMGEPKKAGVIVIGTDVPAVDATCARIMRIDPHRIPYIQSAGEWIGGIKEEQIAMRGERIADVQTTFELFQKATAHRGIRLQ